VFLHGYVGHSFAGDSGIKLSLNARARQFSSFLVLVGRISGPGQFDPQFGFICQNKDEFEIPLDLETIPTPGEFRDAIESLSPEQQQFCKLYRGMQLASTLFGVLVLQLKPQLERVLKLNNEALTKEIRLTQDLIDLFLQYQIPSDLLSFGGAPQASSDQKLVEVKRNVEAMQKMISAAKNKEIADVAMVAQMKMTEAIARPQMQQQQQQQQPQYPPVKFSSPVSRSAGPPQQSAPQNYGAPAPPMSAPPPSAPVATASSFAPPPSQPVAVAVAVAEQPQAVAEVPGKASTKFDAGSEGTSDVDFTKLPTELDAKFEK
jgi:hypothetical protein